MKSPSVSIMCCVAFALAPGGRLHGDCGWSSDIYEHPGTVGPVYALMVHDDGTGPALYAGGDFVAAGNVMSNDVARWDGRAWSSVGGGIQSHYGKTGDSWVTSLATFDDGNGPALYAGRSNLYGIYCCKLQEAFLERWDGEVWSTVKGGPADGYVSALAVFDDGNGPALYAAGGFAYEVGGEATRVLRWDGRAWAEVGSCDVGTQISALEVFDDGKGPSLYAAGSFRSISGVTAAGIARWNGVTWSGVGSGISTRVESLAVFDDGAGPLLYAGGPATFLQWDGAEWTALDATDGGGNLRVLDLGNGPDLYSVNGTVISRWDISFWLPIAGAENVGKLHELAAFDAGRGPELYAGGWTDFAAAGGGLAKNIARLQKGSWFSLGGQGWAPLEIKALFDFDDGTGPALYAGTETIYHLRPQDPVLARYQDGTWTPFLGFESLLAGYAVFVSAFRAFDAGTGPTLYAGGTFTLVNGIEANGLATWDGKLWAPVSAGVKDGERPGWIKALEVFDDGRGRALYAAGTFRSAGGNTAENIARWDGVNWSSVGAGLPETDLHALAVYDNGSGPFLYAGGMSMAPGRDNTAFLAAWDGDSWREIPEAGSTLGIRVEALLAVSGGAETVLYVGHLGASGIHGWNGREWSEVGGGVGSIQGTTPKVSALARFDDGTGPKLFAGGGFSTAGGATARGVASWDGKQWSALSQGIGQTFWDADVRALAAVEDASGPALYAGGAFNAAGPIYSPHFARWTSPVPVQVRTQPETLAVCRGERVVLTAAARGAAPLRLRWRKDGKPIAHALQPELVLDPVETTDAGVYDVVATDRCGESMTSDPVRVLVDAGSCGLFHRGDANDDARSDISDVIFALKYLFGGGAAPGCLEALDADNNGRVELSDAILLLRFLFSGALPPVAPGPATEPCGPDTDAPGSSGDLGCELYASC